MDGIVLDKKAGNLAGDSSNIYISLLLMPFFMLCPIWYIATFIWLPMKEQGEKDAQKAEEEEQALERVYEEYYPVPPTSSEAPKETRIYHLVMEKTPKGFVIMRYNKEEEGFEYWSDTSIDYKYLDTVARKYVWTWQCWGVYINRCEMLYKKIAKLKEEIEKNKKKLEEQESSEDNTDKHVPDEEESLFAVLKRVKRKKKVKHKLKITKEDIVCDVANKFIYRGKLKDPKRWITSDKDPSKNKKPLKWNDWKLLTQKDVI